MRTWERTGYTVVEVEHDYDLHAFNVVQNDKVIATITPPDVESMNEIVADLDAGSDVNGWEDGNGNTVNVPEGIEMIYHLIDQDGYELGDAELKTEGDKIIIYDPEAEEYGGFVWEGYYPLEAYEFLKANDYLGK